MDDGQPRTFKVKFEGEGVDDYGGPYRDVFTTICTEICLLKDGNNVNEGCLLHLLDPIPNWINKVGNERERFLFITHPTPKEKKMLYFFGQFLGIALRSNISLNIPFSSFIWKRLSSQRNVSSSFHLLLEDVMNK